MTSPLSPRETQVLQCAARGMCIKQTAETLGIDHFTVRDHRKSLFKRIQARNIAHAVAIGMSQGVISL